MLHTSWLLATLLCFSVPAFSYETVPEYTVVLLDYVSAETYDGDPSTFYIATYNTVFQFAVDVFNNRTCDFSNLLPNTTLKLSNNVDYGIPSIAIESMIEFSEQGHSLVIGLPNSVTSGPAAIAGQVYNIATFSSFSPSAEFENPIKYPYFTRSCIGVTRFSDILQQALLFYGENRIGWTDVAIISTVDLLSIDFANQFSTIAKKNGVDIIGYQQYLHDQANLDIELQQIVASGARVIVASVFGDLVDLLEKAEAVGLVTENYVWLIAPHSKAVSVPRPSHLLNGALSCEPYLPPDAGYRECYENAYIENMHQYLGFDVFPPEAFNTPFDTIVSVAYTLDALDKEELLDGRRISMERFTEAIRKVSFEGGITGPVSYDEDGNRVGPASIICITNNGTSSYPSGIQDEEGGPLEIIQNVVWFSGTTEIPDLDIRAPFDYWSCDDGKKRHDETGKEIKIQTPDGSDVDEIDIDYHCDYFIDCKNISDERFDCATNYLGPYIAFGVITTVLMLVVMALFVFVVVFGVCLRFQRLSLSSNYILLLMLISIFIGYASVFSFYGKPHPVACGFQPWLLGLPCISIIIILSCKILRIFIFFRFPMRRVQIQDWKLIVMWFLGLIPAIIIIVLWTIFATPTAQLENVDDKDHYVCTSGGLAGTLGGYIFFSIFVAYSALLLFVGAIISILARNLPALLNETKILTFSIYNLGFLGVVIIPVYLVVQPFNPFLAWILRTCAVLYALTATMMFQFLPLVVGVVFIDKLKNKTLVNPTNIKGKHALNCS